MTVKTFTEQYLIENKGSVELYRRYVDEGDRLGQAFMLSLSDSDYNKLAGSLYDPFYKDSQKAIDDAIEFLTRP